MCLTEPCPSCETEATLIGSIPDSSWFAGKNLSSPIEGGRLYSCPACSLHFRWPRLAIEELNDLYKSGNQIHWQYSPETRHDWGLAKAVLQNTDVSRTILDVGCWDGGFLGFLNSDWQKYGIEIHQEAAERAKAAGVEIVATDLAEIVQIDDNYGCVVAFDVIEHVPNPLSFLEGLIQITESGGLIIISTGNSEAWTWRLMGSRYYYAWIPEHISFISPTWCRNIAALLGLEIETLDFFSHARFPSWSNNVKEFIKAIGYTYLPRGYRFLRNLGVGQADLKRYPASQEVPPGWMSAVDHFIISLRKP